MTDFRTYRKRVVIAGGSGFLGRALQNRFQEAGFGVQTLSRSPGPEKVVWDGRTVGDWAKALDGAYGVINLSGVPITRRWTDEGKKAIIDSRVESTRAIAQAIENLHLPPRVWVNASAVGIYGDRGDEVLDEGSPLGDEREFMPECCRLWEAEARSSRTKIAILRIGVVLGNGGGAYEVLSKLTRFGLGGQIGLGRQFVSWIHLEDICRMALYLVENEKEGVYNGTALNPAPNRQLMKEMRGSLRRPWSPPAPPFALRLLTKLGGPESSPVLQSQRVLPSRAMEEGFQFKFADLRNALDDLAANGDSR